MLRNLDELHDRDAGESCHFHVEVRRDQDAAVAAVRTREDIVRMRLSSADDRDAGTRCFAARRNIAADTGREDR